MFERIIPREVTTKSARVDSSVGIPAVPESGIRQRGKIGGRDTVVVSVACAEPGGVSPRQRVECVTGEATDPQLVVVRLVLHCERAVLDMECLASASRQRQLQLVVVALCEQTDDVIADPVVSVHVTEAFFKFLPRLTEEVGSAYLLLDQNTIAVRY